MDVLLREVMHPSLERVPTSSIECALFFTRESPCLGDVAAPFRAHPCPKPSLTSQSSNAGSRTTRSPAGMSQNLGIGPPLVSTRTTSEALAEGWFDIVSLSTVSLNANKVVAGGGRCLGVVGSNAWPNEVNLTRTELPSLKEQLRGTLGHERPLLCKSREIRRTAIDTRLLRHAGEILAAVWLDRHGRSSGRTSQPVGRVLLGLVPRFL